MKQEEPTQHFQSENGNENYVNVLDNAELTASNIKQECEEEDPLNIGDDFEQEIHQSSLVKDNKKSQYNCDKCIKNFTSKRNLHNHIQSAHEKVQYKCDKCEKNFFWKTALSRHMVTVHGNVHVHIKSIHGNVHVKKSNPMLDKLLSDKAKLIFQKSTQNAPIDTEGVHEKVREYYCPLCGKSFSKKGNLKTHFQSIHGNIQYNCDKCGKTFSSKQYLKRHNEGVHENVRYSCDKCGKSFSRKTHLNRHIKSIHQNVQYHCDKCDKSFPRKDILNHHIASVHENVPYNCQ